MLRSRSVRISENIYITSSPTLYVSKLLGLFPFAINSSGSVRKLKWSAPYQIYSVLLLITIVTFTISGMTTEIQMGDRSFRMKGTTSRYVTCVDIIMVEIITILGILNPTVLSQRLYAFMNYLSEIDAIIDMRDVQTARTVSIYGLTVIIGSTSFLLGFDLYVWYTSAETLDDGGFVITNYLPFHLSYFIVVLIKCLYAHMGYCMKIRLTAINDNLRNINFKNNEEQTTLGAAIRPETNRFPTKNILSKRNQILLNGFGKRSKVSHLPHVKYDKGPVELSENDRVLQLTKAYLIICDAADALNDVFGHVILVILITSLLHLTVSPYFFIVELIGRSDTQFLILQSLWFLTYFFHLVLVVEPCNICLEEAKLMNGSVCRILSSGVADNYKKQLELLFTQLQYRQIEFSAFGLGTIDRSLVTSMAGAVTVYLVTIIQFRNSATN